MSAPKEKIAAQMTEAQLQRNVMDLLSLTGWLAWHAWSSVHSGAGFPDIVALRGPEMVVIELKSEKGKLTAPQMLWLAGFEATGTHTFVWRPRDWCDGTIEQTLKRP